MFRDIERRARFLLSKLGKVDPEWSSLNIVECVVEDYVIASIAWSNSAKHVTVRHRDCPFTQFDSRPDKASTTMSMKEWLDMLNALRRAMVLDDLAAAGRTEHVDQAAKRPVQAP